MNNFHQPKLNLQTPNIVENAYALTSHKLLQKRIVNKYLLEADKVEQILIKFEFLDSDDLDGMKKECIALAKTNRLHHNRTDLLKSLAWLSILCQKKLNMKPYRVQLASALAMLDGYLVQLAPGEGKTLTIGLVSSVFAWSGKPCHVITANDYLAMRDAQLMHSFFKAQGLSVSSVNPEMSPAEKALTYRFDVVYGTAKQMLADYLSDVISFDGLASQIRLDLTQLQGNQQGFLMRGLYSVIVDEADSILVDDATTPLIISQPEPNPLLNEAVMLAKQFVDELQAPEDYQLESEDWEVKFSTLGYEKLERAMPGFPKLWNHWARFEELITQGILARDKFKQDEHYIVLDGKVVLVDESTGRLMHGRSWSYGIHQAVEARAGLELSAPSRTIEKMSFQSFFQSYHRLTGSSGTLQNIQSELFYTYGTHTLEIPTQRPSKLTVEPFHFFKLKNQKIAHLMNSLKLLLDLNKPVLIGTKTIKDTEYLSDVLDSQGVEFVVLNAKHLEKEAEIIAQAGSAGRVTLATNMAGRGTDINVSKEVLKSGGLTVIMFEPHEAARIDWQLFGRAGRQGNPGAAIPLVSAEDSLFFWHLRWWQKPVLFSLKRGFLPNSVVGLVINWAQKNAQSKAFKKRKYLLKLDQLSQERMSFVKNKTKLRK